MNVTTRLGGTAVAKQARWEGTRPDDLHYGHPRMPLSERAKIFMPFDALKGFREAIEEREHLTLEAQRDFYEEEPPA